MPQTAISASGSSPLATPSLPAAGPEPAAAGLTKLTISAAPTPCVVLKFGSSVLRTEADLADVVHACYTHVRAGRSVVAVVSAIGDTTDRLLARARAFGTASDHPTAALLATGEARSAALLSLALARAGVPAHIAPPHLLALRTRGPVLDAEPSSVDTGTLRRLLAERPVVVVPGFVGADAAGHPTLLGRGGSDLSAVFLAGALRAPCVLVKDVDGLYDRDPAQGRATRFATASYADALACGGRLLQAKALDVACAAGVAVTVTSLAGRQATIVHAGATRPAVPTPAPSPLRVGLLGLGTVGGGVLERLRARPAQFDVVGVLVRRPTAARRAAACTLLTDCFEALLARTCDVLVDATGDTQVLPGKVTAALAGGVAVVSANKAALARHLGALRRAASAGGSDLRFSAAVGGAVPMLALARRVRRVGVAGIDAIVNVTSNFVLAELARGAPLPGAVAAARAAGFAEGDVLRDLDGRDAADKLVLLAEAAFGAVLDPAAVARTDLRSVVVAHARAAVAAGGEPRLVASLRRAGTDLEASVAPRVLTPDDPLFGTRPEDSRIVVTAADGTRHVAGGGGAGRWPTTEAVFGDLLELWHARAGAPAAAVPAEAVS